MGSRRDDCGGIPRLTSERRLPAVLHSPCPLYLLPLPLLVSPRPRPHSMHAAAKRTPARRCRDYPRIRPLPPSPIPMHKHKLAIVHSFPGRFVDTFSSPQSDGTYTGAVPGSGCARLPSTAPLVDTLSSNVEHDMSRPSRTGGRPVRRSTIQYNSSTSLQDWVECECLGGRGRADAMRGAQS